jgi:SAM-dependent methyltransferase
MYDDIITEWETGYRRTGHSSTVDFRALVPEVTTERLTHLLHSYPAKLLPNIPYLFLNSSLARQQPNAAILDPFCGSGTVLLEGAIKGLRVIGADSNPLARLIAKVKTHPLTRITIDDALLQVNRSFDRIRNAEPPPVVNIDLWYREKTIFELAKLRKAIGQVRSQRAREFLLVCFSVCVRKVSLADPRMSVPVKINLKRKDRYGPHYTELAKHLRSLNKVSVRQRFNEIVRRNALRMENLRKAFPTASPSVSLFTNALGLEEDVSAGEVQLIISSPPYSGAQKYIRASSLSLGWLDMAYEGQLRGLERQSVGREHYPLGELGKPSPLKIAHADRVLARVAKIYPLRAHIGHTYLSEMGKALQSMYRVLTPGGHLVLVTGSNTICGNHFDTPAYLEQLAQRVGFQTRFKLIDHIRSRGLMTKRNKTASIIASEHVLCMRKQ